jgi:hypothetical protein
MQAAAKLDWQLAGMFDLTSSDMIRIIYSDVYVTN